MDTTARQIITLALKECGVIGVGQTPLAEDFNDAFILLNRMCAQWQKKRWLIPALIDISMPGNGLRSNKIGPGQYWNYPRPDKIQAAYVVQTNGFPETRYMTAGDFSNDFSNDFNNFHVVETPVDQNNLGLNVSIPLKLIQSYEDYARIAVKSLASLPNYLFYDGAQPYGNVFTWPVPDARYQVHLIVKANLGFATGLKKLQIVSEGTNYIDGIYSNVPVLNTTNSTNTKKPGIGENGTVNVEVISGQIISIEVNKPGNSYALDNYLSLDPNYMSFDGEGGLFKIIELQSNPDIKLDMGDEYFEALHYNLAIRLCSMYQLSPQPSTITLAKLALNTIKIANTQVPTMNMPITLTQPRAYNIYSDYGY